MNWSAVRIGCSDGDHVWIESRVPQRSNIAVVPGCHHYDDTVPHRLLDRMGQWVKEITLSGVGPE